jgi:hypothetical protein
MVLRGRFGDTSGRPYLEGRLVLPGLDLRSDISFIVDTGADQSVLMPGDAIRMGLDYGKLTGNVTAAGIGGLCQNFVEEAILAFSEPGKALYIYRVNIQIPAPSPDILDIPSLLGRDVLDRWSMTYTPSRKRLHFRVITADLTAPIPKQ